MIIHHLERKKQEPRQIFATIRQESKYSNQQPVDKAGNFIPFSVTLAFESDPFWPVKGGIGGNYSLYDVELWLHTGEKLERLTIHSMKDVSIPLARLSALPVYV